MAFFFDNKLFDRFSLIFFNGQVGVTIFFIISGFLITYLLLIEENKTGSISLKKFYFRRTIRIFPAYYFLLFVYFILQQVGILYFDKISWITSLTYTKQFGYGIGESTVHLWSLSVEEIFYLVWPFLFSQFRKKRNLIILIGIIAVTIGRYFEYRYPKPLLGNTIFSAGDALLIGCWFATRYQWMKQSVKKNYLIPLALFLIFSILLYAYTYHLESVANPNALMLTVINYFTPLFYAIFGNIGLVTIILMMLIIFSSINISNKWWFTFLNSKVMSFIGKISYGIYLWQGLFTSNIPFFRRFPIGILVLFILGASLFSYFLIEKPLLQLKKKYEVV